jgi:hypothetical protein
MSNLIRMNCPSCGAKIRAVDESGLFHCEHCGNEHRLQMNFIPVEPARSPKLRPRMPIPHSIKIEKDGLTSRIVQRWFSWKYLPMAFFAFAWDSFLIFWYITAIASGAPVIFIIFPVAHLAVGIWITYTTLAGFFNHTTVELSQGKLSVWFDPLPWPGEKSLRANDIKQLFCKEVIKRSGEGSTTTSYHLYALDRQDHQIKLLTNLETPEVVQFLEQQLEEWLRIRNEPVEGEYY